MQVDGLEIGEQKIVNILSSSMRVAQSFDDSVKPFYFGRELVSFGIFVLEAGL